MSEKDEETLGQRMANIMCTITDCATLLGIEIPVAAESIAGNTIDRLVDGFDVLDDLGAHIRDQLHRL